MKIKRRITRVFNTSSDTVVQLITHKSVAQTLMHDSPEALSGG